jgi:oligopeptide transport system substrate-binding protein
MMSRMAMPLRLGAACAIAIAGSMLTGCHGGAPRLNFPPDAKVLRMNMPDDVPTMDPAAGYDTPSWTFEQMVFDTLVRYSDAGVDLQPDVALRWESSPDSTVFTFHLRNDVRFTNGRPVTGEDFKYGIERVLDPATRSKGMEYYRAIAGAPDFIAHHAAHVSGIETPDPYTIVFHLSAPDPIFVHKLAMPFASAVPREVAEKWGEDFSRHVVGSGPFIMKEWIGGQRVVMVKNPDYFIKGLPHLDAVVYLIGVNEELDWFKFEAGETDVVVLIPTAEFPYVMKTPALSALVLKNITVTTRYLGMNCQMWPFTDPRVRQAFNYAIDKKKIIALLNGRGIVATGVLPPSLPGYNPEIESYPYDPAKARRLLEAAGVGSNFEPVIWLQADRTFMMLGQSIQQDLALVGVHVGLRPVAWGPFLEAIRQPKTAPLFLLAWEADFPDPENFLDVLLSRKQWGANNDSFFSNPDLDAILAAAAPIADMPKRYGLYQQAEKIAVAQAPWVFLYYPVNYVIRQPWVHDYVLNPTRPTRLEKVWISPHPGS